MPANNHKPSTNPKSSTNPAPQQRLDPQIQTACKLFALAVVGGDGNRVIVYNRLRAMTPAERDQLRQGLERLDGELDQVALDLHLQRDKGSKGNNSNGGRNGNHAS